MLGQIQYIDDYDRPVSWKLGDKKGLIFEAHLFNVIKHDLEPYFSQGLRISKTSNTRDDGIDIFIQSPIDFSLFGVTFRHKPNDVLKIVIECKSTDQCLVSLEKFSKNVLIYQQECPDYFVLVTNGSIAPFSYYMAANNAQDNSYRFVLIDQRQLAPYLERQNAMIGEYSAKPVKTNKTFSIEYQICKGRIGGKNCFELYLLLRNNSDRAAACSLQLLTDRNWSFDCAELDIIIDPFQNICKKMLVTKEYNDGIEDFALKINFDNQYKILKISNTGINYNFEPPLSGEAHKRLIQEITEALLSLKGSVVYYLFGEAGIGKTRIVDEVYKQVSNTSYNFISILLEKANLDQRFQSMLASKLDCNSSEWNAIRAAMEYNTFTKYCFIIEDIHNATTQSIIEIKAMLAQLRQCKQPVAIILAGRDDDTVYNEAFFSFSEWLKTRKKTEVLSRQVQPLTDPECYRFIQSMILEIPELVLKKIFSMSRNNPYYIVQFIEYLLEVKIVKLLNRNTVGIANVKTFCKHVYIPRKIEDLLSCREKWLLQREFGREYHEFLQILAIFGLSAPKDLIYAYWGIERSEVAEYLFHSRFLAFTSGGGIRFDHESLYLFYAEKLKEHSRMRRLSKRIVRSFPEVLNMLMPLQRGKVYFYSNHYEEAYEIFQPIIEAVHAAGNISSVNIPSEYFPYLDELYELSRKSNDLALQKRILISTVYVSIHNCDYGTACRTIDSAFVKIEANHKDDLSLFMTIFQLKAHATLNTADLSQARKYFQELLAQERLTPEVFTEESRFDLFDRCASLFTRYNHQAVAQKYNLLAKKTAESLEDAKLMGLATMMQAKIIFYSDTQASLLLMEQARKIISTDMAFRINCHNNASILSASILLSNLSVKVLTELIFESKKLLEEAVDQNYSFTMIRCNLTLATLYYYLADYKNQYLALSKKHVETGISVSIRYGCEKLMNYFYNLKAVISIYEGESMEVTMRYFETMLSFLRQQDLLFLGNLDFCYGNIISLTNYVKFVLQAGGEQQLYRLLSSIHYYQSEDICDFDCNPAKSCYYTCLKSVDRFKTNYRRVQKGGLLFIDSKYRYPLIDPKTGYFLVLH